LARELKGPVAAMDTNLVRAREILRSVAATTRPEARGTSTVRVELFDADEELAEALVGLARIRDVVRGIELPTREGSPETTDLTEVLRLTMRLVQTELRSSSSLELDVKPVPPVAGSTAKLGQVVLNLLVNALQAMAWEPRSKKMLSIRLVPEEGWVRFEVADSGPGILPEFLPHVFDPFSPAGKDRGTGLGLAISRMIVEEIGGHIEAENRPTGGALFRIRLPAMGDTRIINVDRR
jgi:C4-dicarboxylate-specific signal transduction histidine kinase